MKQNQVKVKQVCQGTSSLLLYPFVGTVLKKGVNAVIMSLDEVNEADEAKASELSNVIVVTYERLVKVADECKAENK